MAIGGVDLSSVGGWFANTGTSVGKILIVFLILAIVGVGVFALYNRKIQKKEYVATINLFKVVNGKKFWVGSSKAKEVVIPGTNVRLLYWKKHKIWSAYPTRSIGFNVYAYMLNRMGELTNFDLGEGADETEAKIDYDHRDQTYAYLNLQEFITRNYKQRDVKSWWKENLHIISTIIIMVFFFAAMWFFFAKSGQQQDVWLQISSNMKEAAQYIGNAVNQASGIGSGVSGG